ncbi:MAG: hypothetical protein CME06_13315 [Gemmatimonadetes bacterium]|nr:hypothetical protein [Gemmatimonadota bacterium]
MMVVATLLASCSSDPDVPPSREEKEVIERRPLAGPGQRRAGLPQIGSRVAKGRVDCETCEGEIQVIVYESDSEAPSDELIRGIAWVREPWRFDIDGLPDDATLTIVARWDPGGKVIRGEPIGGTRISRPQPLPEPTQLSDSIVIDLGAATEFGGPAIGGPAIGEPGTGQGSALPGGQPHTPGGIAERPSGPPLARGPEQHPGGSPQQRQPVRADQSYQPAPVSNRPLRTVSGKVLCESCGGRVAVFLSAVPTLDPQSTDVVDKSFIDSDRSFIFRGVPATRRVYLGARWDADGEPGPGLPGADDLSTSIVITPLRPGEEAEPFEIVLKAD